MFDLSLTKMLGPGRDRAYRLRAERAAEDRPRRPGGCCATCGRIAEGAKADLREGLGPEFQDFDFEDLNPSRFVRKHLFDEAEQQALFDQFSVHHRRHHRGDDARDRGRGERERRTRHGVPSATLRDGEQPPFDFEAT